MKGVTVTEEDFSVMNYDTVETVLYQIKVDMAKYREHLKKDEYVSGFIFL